MNYKIMEKTFISILQRKEKENKPFEVDVTHLAFKERETLRYKLMDQGIRCEMYSELKRSFISVG